MGELLFDIKKGIKKKAKIPKKKVDDVESEDENIVEYDAYIPSSRKPRVLIY